MQIDDNKSDNDKFDRKTIDDDKFDDGNFDDGNFDDDDCDDRNRFEAIDGPVAGTSENRDIRCTAIT